MVGTAYRSPEPGTPPFVEIGTQVTAGQTLLIIEAMKTMNQIPAPKPARCSPFWSRTASRSNMASRWR